ncbi:MAG: tripartite tricarboxylate transporter permease, partial [Methanocellales archaeon]
MIEVSLPLLLLSICLGLVLGLFTGLTPGIHVNNAALFLVGISPMLYALGFAPLYIAIIIISNSISHTFLDIIPAIFLGAPGDDTALAVLPGHKLLLQGRGEEAIRLSAFGSAASVAVSLLLLLPVALFFITAYPLLEKHMPWVLLAIALLLIATERGRGNSIMEKLKFKLYAAIVFILAGAIGYFAFKQAHLMKPLIELSEPSILFPLLSGLFGASMLIVSLFTYTVIPPQRNEKICLSGRKLARGAFIGSLSGSLVAWLPGVSAGVATVLARLAIKDEEDEASEFLVSVNGVNTANAIFGVIALFVIGKTRSGAMVAVNNVLDTREFSLSLIALFLLAIVAVAIVSYFLTILIGMNISAFLPKVNYPKLCLGILIFLALS